MSDDRRSNDTRDSTAPLPSEATDAALSALALGLTPVEPPAGARTRLLGALRTRERFSLFASEIARAFGLSSEAMLAALRAIDDEHAWHGGLGLGGSWLSTPELSVAQVVIARLPANTVIPRHAHQGHELTFVLDGLLIENGSTHCGPGSLLDPANGSQHELVVGADKTCTVVFRPATLRN